MEACAGLQPRYEDRYDRAFDAHRAVADQADSLFGAEPTLEPWETAAEGCGERAFATYEAAARAGLAEARQRLAEVTALMPGLWVGTLHVCGANLADAKIEPYLEAAMWRLNIQLLPAFRERLLAETERKVGKPMSVHLDGKMVMQPIVYEPLSTGSVALTGPEREVLEQVRAATLRSC